MQNNKAALLHRIYHRDNHAHLEEGLVFGIGNTSTISGAFKKIKPALLSTPILGRVNKEVFHLALQGDPQIFTRVVLDKNGEMVHFKFKLDPTAPKRKWQMKHASVSYRISIIDSYD